MKKLYLFFCLCFLLSACSQQSEVESKQAKSDVSLIILGTVQDAGSPHIACKKECCKKLFAEQISSRMVVSLGVVDRKNNKTFLFEATPDIAQQLKELKQYANFEQEIPDGIFLTHAHIGHYSGLMYLGKEAINTSKTPVYAMPKMQSFLQNNGPWSQLVQLNNIKLMPLENDRKLQVTDQIAVTPLLVPHRDEFSETVGFKIETQSKKVLFIPDIDKWEKWPAILPLIKECDYVFIDGTFYDAAEVNHRNISEIPHPFVVESMALFKDLSAEEKAKIHFIHFNHTNPLHNKSSKKYTQVEKAGYKIANFKESYEL